MLPEKYFCLTMIFPLALAAQTSSIHSYAIITNAGLFLIGQWEKIVKF